MQKILSSKFYKSSTRRSEIRAKVQDPVNSELVLQLREYLEDDIVLAPGAGIEPVPSEVEEILEEDLLDEELEGEEDPGDLGASTEPTPQEPVVANTVVTDVNITLDINQLPGQLKGHLNLREETKGVNRIQIKEKELWVYYNDDVNLNDRMTPVLELLNAATYTYLQFNRLARSDNAIVFDFDRADTNNKTIPIRDVKGEGDE